MGVRWELSMPLWGACDRYGVLVEAEFLYSPVRLALCEDGVLGINPSPSPDDRHPDDDD